MSDTPQFGFGNFVPGFDFLKNLTQGKPHAANPAASMPSMSSWVAPTLSVEEIEKRIQELKTVQFWLDQNGRALAATVQALEVQKMTLSTLKGMNVSMSELAKAFQFGPAAGGAASNAAQHASDSHAPSTEATETAPSASAAPDDRVQTDEDRQTDASAQSAAKDEESTAPTMAKGLVDPMQWWGALTNQFQQIAATAMQEAARHAQPDAATNDTGGKTQPAGSAEQAKQAEKTLKAATEAASSMTSAMAQQAAQHMSAVQKAAAQAMKAVIPAAASAATAASKTGAPKSQTTKTKVQTLKSKAAVQTQPQSTAAKRKKAASVTPKPGQVSNPKSLSVPAKKRATPAAKKPPSSRR